MSIFPEGSRDEKMFSVFRKIYRTEVKKHWDKTTHAYGGIVEMLAEIQKLGLKTGILSNKLDEIIKLVVAKFLPERNFLIVRGLLPGKPEKPNPMDERNSE